MLLIELPAKMSGKASDDGPSTGFPAIHGGRLDVDLGSWVPPGPALVLVSIEGIS